MKTKVARTKNKPIIINTQFGDKCIVIKENDKFFRFVNAENAENLLEEYNIYADTKYTLLCSR